MNLRKINLLVIAFLLLTAVFPSCKGTKYAKEIASLDSLQTALVKADSVLNSIDTVKTEAYYLEAKNNLTFIQNNFKDTMEREMAMFLSDFHSILEPLEMYNEEREKLTRELDYSQKQIENLIHDLKNNAVKESEITEYCSNETEAANEIISSVNTMTAMVKGLLTDFEKKNKRVLEIVKVLSH